MIKCFVVNVLPYLVTIIGLIGFQILGIKLIGGEWGGCIGMVVYISIVIFLLVGYVKDWFKCNCH